MASYCVSHVFRTVATVAFAFAAGMTYAAEPVNACVGPKTVASNERASVWLNAVATFEQEEKLTEAQIAWLRDAAQAGANLSSDQTDVLGASVARLQRLAARAPEVLSARQIGSLFSRTGSLQSWLATTGVIAYPYCNCVRAWGDCTRPVGPCSPGCVTWDSIYDGVCTAPSQTEELP